MKIKFVIDPKYDIPHICICCKEKNEQMESIYKAVDMAVNNAVKAYDGDEVYLLRDAEIIRIYTQHQQVYAATQNKEYRLHNRLYEMEQMLDGNRFLRISNSEIVNLKMIKRLDTSITGTIKMYLAADLETYVSRRYVTKIKQTLGL